MRSAPDLADFGDLDGQPVMLEQAWCSKDREAATLVPPEDLVIKQCMCAGQQIFDLRPAKSGAEQLLGGRRQCVLEADRILTDFAALLVGR